MQILNILYLLPFICMSLYPSIKWYKPIIFFCYFSKIYILIYNKRIIRKGLSNVYVYTLTTPFLLGLIEKQGVYICISFFHHLPAIFKLCYMHRKRRKINSYSPFFIFLFCLYIK